MIGTMVYGAPTLSKTKLDRNSCRDGLDLRGYGTRVDGSATGRFGGRGHVIAADSGCYRRTDPW